MGSIAASAWWQTPGDIRDERVLQVEQLQRSGAVDLKLVGDRDVVPEVEPEP